MEYSQDFLDYISDRIRIGLPNECWEWTGFVDPSGYGWASCVSNRKPYRKIAAHRLSWEMANYQKVPEGMCVCHTCDNRRCVNPRHLFLGTLGENILDAFDKGRLRRKLTVDEVKEIRERGLNGERQKDMAQRYSVKPSTIHAIINRKIWRHVE